MQEIRGSFNSVFVPADDDAAVAELLEERERGIPKLS
jgi:hypothetical protein